MWVLLSITLTFILTTSIALFVVRRLLRALEAGQSYLTEAGEQEKPKTIRKAWNWVYFQRRDGTIQATPLCVVSCPHTKMVKARIYQAWDRQLSALVHYHA